MCLWRYVVVYFLGARTAASLLSQNKVKESSVPVVEIPNAGHFMMLDNEKGFYGEILRLVKRFEGMS